jgi:methylenetetrahydrofolate reductase (NADPH)
VTRYEILPLDAVEPELATAPKPLVVTVTCSPRHGVDRTVEVAERVAALGHKPVPHVAARTIRDERHLDAVLERLAAAGVEDVFVIAGDGHAPAGPFEDALKLLPLVAGNRYAPPRIGVAAYPEGHPFIDDRVLEAALKAKAPLAAYMVTQLCFDPGALTRWLERTRAAGIDLPLYVGLPGAVDRRHLLEVSMRIGVGTSIAFVRKQRGLRRLLGSPTHTADQLHAALAPLVGGDGIEGLHYFTFNRLTATLAWEAERSRKWLIAST